MSPGSIAEHHPVQLAEQLAILRARKWWIVFVASLTIGAALALTLIQETAFVSHAQVLLRPAAVGGGGRVEEPNMATERQLAGSAAVAMIAAQDLARQGAPPDEAGGLVVTVVEDTEILTFQYSSRSALAAQRGAQAYAEAYLRFRAQQAEEETAEAARALAQKIQLQQQQLRAVNQRLARTQDQFERTSLEAQQIALATEIGALRNQLTGLEATDGGPVGRIVAPALLGIPSEADPIRNGVLGAIAGLALGIGVAFVVERLDDRVRSTEMLEALTGATTLSVIPKIPNRVLRRGLVMLDAAGDQYAEAFRALRTGLMFAASGSGTRTILVTSPNPGDGKTHTVANLAVALAQAGKRVVAVSADLRRPQLHRALGVPEAPGLGELIVERRTIWDLLTRPIRTENLWVLPSGRANARPSDLAGSREMGETLATLKDSADYVLVDVGPVLAVPDAIALVPHVDAVILVVAADRTTRSAVRRAIHQLRLVHSTVLGTVLNGFQPHGDSAGASP